MAKPTIRQIDEAMDVNSPEAALWAERMSLLSRNEYLAAERKRLLDVLGAIARRAAPSTRTFDESIRDMDFVCALARKAIADAHPET